MRPAGIPMTARPDSAPVPVLRAVLWMTGAVLSFTAMAVAGRESSFALKPIEIMMYRSIISLIMVVAVAHVAGTLGQITRRKFGWQIARNLMHFTGQYLWFLAITLLPLAQVFAVEFTGPLWALILSTFILRERLTRNRVIAAAVGFVGILIIARPGAEPMSAGLIAAGISAVALAAAVVLTRRLTRTETLTCILFWMFLMQTILGVFFVALDGHVPIPSLAALPWLFLVALGGLVAHFCLTTALAIAPASVVLPIDFARLPLIAVIGALLYAEIVDIWVFVGAAVIFAANYTNIIIESRAGRAPRPVV